MKFPDFRERSSEREGYSRNSNPSGTLVVATPSVKVSKIPKILAIATRYSH
ncbi:hypothetical protein MtrunA17_Chr8g0362471 [Medicago truncatula]|uniref:Uncharacterized protein n=1 Tax=Medicago truncatula TaxID=3880 RepID=A0A396GJ16_MEDTR|nr:hypothetical protein MtrunA17_Chr8g0362471 [Medicago truncatula]